MVKLINFFEFAQFNQLRYDMGAPILKIYKSDLQLSSLNEDDMKKLSSEGIDVDLDEIKTEKDKTLSYKGQRVLVYIRDISKYAENKLTLPRFHISYCKTLEDMTIDGRWTRYVVANREDGYFQVNIIKNKVTEAKTEKLIICQNCLETLRWNNFSIRGLMKSLKNRIISQFSISEFFQKYPKSLFSIKPEHSSDIAPINNYSSDWNHISYGFKKKMSFQCQESNCRIILTGTHSRYLHVHHIDGQKSNNKESNLKVICLRCHAEEPRHSHMKNSSEYKKFISDFQKFWNINHNVKLAIIDMETNNENDK